MWCVVVVVEIDDVDVGGDVLIVGFVEFVVDCDVFGVCDGDGVYCDLWCEEEFVV